MASSNGKQHHRTALEIIADHKAKMYRPWHWPSLDLDVLIRPRSAAEAVALADRGARMIAAMEEYKGTPDAPAMQTEQLRMAMEVVVDCILDPETREPMFGIEDVDELTGLELAAINELIHKVEEVASFTQAQADDAAKNSEATAGDRPSSASPSPAEASTPSPTPIR